MAVGTKSRYLGMRGVRHDPPRRFDQATYLDFDVKPFRGKRCERCTAGLWDLQGNPRWDFTGGRFVCQQGVGCGGAT